MSVTVTSGPVVEWMTNEAPKYGIEETILDSLPDELMDVTTYGSTSPTYIARGRQWRAYLRFAGSATIGIGDSPFAAIAQALKEHLKEPE